MSRLETVIVGVLVGLVCPLLTLVFFWWTAAIFYLYFFSMPVGVVIAAAAAGLALGCVLDAVFLRRWIGKFYTANMWLMRAVYLGLCIAAVAFFMGVPIGTFALGIVLGAYIGRREHHRQADGLHAASAVRRAAFFAALVTAAAAFPIGILALQSEQYILRWLEAGLGFSPKSLQGGTGLAFISLLCFILFATQYWCSQIAGWLAFRVGKTSP
jgi:hypothetical protein